MILIHFKESFKPNWPRLMIFHQKFNSLFCKTREIPISEKWKNHNFGYKIVISVKNMKFILLISDDKTDFIVGIVS